MIYVAPIANLLGVNVETRFVVGALNFPVAFNLVFHAFSHAQKKHVTSIVF